MAINKASQLVVFRVDHQRYALSLATVDRIVRAVEVTPLPNAPAIVLGAVDIHGRVLPVLNLRCRLGLPESPISPANYFLIARTSSREVVLVIDEAEEVVDFPAGGIVDSGKISPGLKHIAGVIQLDDGLVLIQDLEAFLSLDEERALAAALEKEVAHAR